MTNFNIPSPPSGKRPNNTYQWLGLIQKVLRETKGIEWNAVDTMSITQLIESIGNDLDFKTTVNENLEAAIRATFTPINILNALKKVDGDTSGLDADTVKGYVPVNKAGDEMTDYLTLHKDPLEPLHAATKQYVDNAIEGFIIKVPVKVATTENITLSGLFEIDGIPVRINDRVLVKNQTDKKENGIYNVTEDGWIRSSDANTDNDLKPGSYVFVNEGLKNKDSSWVLLNDAVELDVTEIEFIQFSGTGQIIPGIGLAKDGNTIFMTNTGVAPGIYTKYSVDEQGRIVETSLLEASDIPNLDWSKITTGKPTTIEGYGILNGVRTDIDNIINGNLRLNKTTMEIINPSSGFKIYVNDSTNTNTVNIQSGIDGKIEGNMELSGLNRSNLNSLIFKANNANVKINNDRILTVADLGTGNLLDADTVDGLHAISFMRSDVDTSTIGILKINKDSNLESALQIISPDNEASSISLLRNGSGAMSWKIEASTTGNLVFASKINDNTFDIAGYFDSVTKELFINDGKVWHQNNHGSGSGLDADLLDGNHGEFYRNASNIVSGTLDVARLDKRVLQGDNETWSTDEGANFNYNRSGFKRISSDIGLIHWAHPNKIHSMGISLDNRAVDATKCNLEYYKLNDDGTDVFRYKIWHNGMQGHGTGMDADTIDGRHLSELTSMFANVTGDTMTGFLTLHADPIEPLHAATKQYVDGVVQGLDFKQSVACATTSNITTLSGLLLVDAYQIKNGDRVLVKNQTDKRNNGIYIANGGTWVRSSDANNIDKLNIGSYVFVENGTVNDSSGWVIDNITAGDLGIAEITFIQFSGAGQIIAGTGLGKNGNEIYLTNTGVTRGTYTKVTIDNQGRVTSGTGLTATDIPVLDWSKITTGKPTTVQGYGITNAVRTDFTSTVNADLIVGDNHLHIKAIDDDCAFLEFFARRNSGTRSGWIGYGNNASNILTIYNEIGEMSLGMSSHATTIRGSAINAIGDLFVKKECPILTLDNTVSGVEGKRAAIKFKCPEGQHIDIVHVYHDNECPIPGAGLMIKSVDSSASPGFLQVMGEIFTGTDGLKKVYHTGNFNPGNYLPLTGGTITGTLRVNELFNLDDKLTIDYDSAGWAWIGSPSTKGDCCTKYKDNGEIEFFTNKSTNGLKYNGKKVWSEHNDGSGSGLDADLLDGVQPATTPDNNTIVKRTSDGSIEAKTTKTNKIALGAKAEIVFNEADASIDFIII